MEKTIFQTRLKELRNEKGFSYETLGNKTDMSKSYIWRMEHQPSNPSYAKLRRLAHALNTSVEYLMGKTVPVVSTADKTVVCCSYEFDK